MNDLTDLAVSYFDTPTPPSFPHPDSPQSPLFRFQASDDAGKIAERIVSAKIECDKAKRKFSMYPSQSSASE